MKKTLCCFLSGLVAVLGFPAAAATSGLATRLADDCPRIIVRSSSLGAAAARLYSRETLTQLAPRLAPAADTARAVDRLARTAVLPIGAAENPRALLARLRSRPEVEFAECDSSVRALAAVIPDDARFSEQWGLQNDGSGGGAADADVDAPEAWAETLGDPSTVIAVLDTGLDLSHGELSGRVLLVSGADLVNGDDVPEDDAGHGTHVTGIAAAAGNNGQGIAGLCWRCRVMPIKVLDQSGTGAFSNVAAGIVLAAANGARVINLSLGAGSYSQAIQDALDAAQAAGVVAVAAAGNGASEAPVYPAANAGVLAVAALDRNDDPSDFTSRGDWIDLAAPGSEILSTLPGQAYGTWSGTSMAAPFVAGIAGLVSTAHPTWSAALVASQIARSTDSVSGDGLGSGRANAYRALTAVPVPDVVVESVTVDDADTLICPSCDGDGQADIGETIDLVVAIRNLYGAVESVSGTLSVLSPDIVVEQPNAAYGDLAPGQSSANTAAPFRVHIDNALAGAVSSLPLGISAAGGYAVAGVVELLIGPQNAGGDIAADTTWTNGSTVYVSTLVRVVEGARLTVEPGVTVRFGRFAYLEVDGELVARGSAESPIAFVAADPELGWGELDEGGIQFLHTSVPATYDGTGNYVSGSILERSVVQGVMSGPAVSVAEVAGSTGGPFIHRCLFQDNELSPLEISSAAARVERNLFLRNGAPAGIGLYAGELMVEPLIFAYNLFADGAGAQIEGEGPLQFYANTFRHNAGAVSFPEVGVISRLDGNNFVANHDGNNFEMIAPLASPPLDATGSYWGTTDAEEIAAWIYDDADDGSGGRTQVLFEPFLQEPSPAAPAFPLSLTLAPPSPVGAQRVTFTAVFSRSMDPAVTPSLTFGLQSPYTELGAVAGVWTSTRLPNDTIAFTYDVATSTPDGTYKAVLTGAVDDGGMSLPGDSGTTFVVDTPVGIAQGVAIGWGMFRSSGAHAGSAAGRAATAVVSWQPVVEDDLSGYTLLWGTEPESLVNAVDAGLAAYVRVGGLTPGETYSFAVRTREDSGAFGPLSEVVTATAPEAVPVPVFAAPAVLLALFAATPLLARSRCEGPGVSRSRARSASSVRRHVPFSGG
ncbi:MAG: S8 family serine peptidase [Candidatus Schekmanbacteria bacterium]|nr:S8 family serine peptidase [Candidatus Schekmanbacteria bacterium]